MKDSELRALLAQVNPHFLFNCLNSLRALTVEDPLRAQEMIDQLASVLRYSLQSERSQTVSLESEIEAIRAYLRLESMRFEDRLRVDIDVDPLSRLIAIPPMLVQTLGENDVKHGIGRIAQGSETRVTSKLEAAGLKIQVINTGRLGSESSGGTEIGLHNARERLRILYGSAGVSGAAKFRRRRGVGRSVGSAATGDSMNALIVDHERLARNELRRLLASHPEIEIAGEARDAFEAATLIRDGIGVLVFRHVNAGTGLNCWSNWKMCRRCFYDGLRPIRNSSVRSERSRLSNEAGDTGAARFRAGQAPLMPETAPLVKPERIFVRDGERCWFVSVADIAVMESEGNYARLYFGDSRPLLPRSLNYLEERLDGAVFSARAGSIF